LKLTTHQNMSSFDERPNTHFDARVAWALETYPPETCNILGAMLRPHSPIFHVPHAIPIHAPWPIHDVLDLFQLCIVVMFFFCWTLTSSSMFPH
jgi:hypothetical protein